MHRLGSFVRSCGPRFGRCAHYRARARTSETPRVGFAFTIATPSLSAQAPPAHARHADDERTAARGRSEQEVLIQDSLFGVPGKQAHLLRIEYPAGWIGRRHYHTGDVFLYVLEGRFSIDVEGQERRTLGPGEVYHEAVKTEMQARNASASAPTKILLFQIGNPGERLTVITD